MPFRDPITAGNTLIRDAIASPDYASSAGATGWSINRDGTAVFNNVTSRGTFETGVAPNPRVRISTKPVVGLNPAYAQIEMFSAAAGEIAGGKLLTQADQFGRTFTFLESNDMGFGPVALQLEAPATGASTPLVSVRNFTTSSALLQFAVEGMLSASAQPYAYATDSTTRSTAGAAYAGVAGQTTTFVMACPPSNKVLLLFWALTNNATVGANTLMDMELRDGSLGGAVIDAATDIGCVRNNSTGNQAGFGMRLVDLSALPPATGQIYGRAVFRVTAGTGNFVQSAVCAIGLP